jgi:hypothetical protein
LLKKARILPAGIAVLMLCACGLEDYPYLPPVESVTREELNTRAVITLPDMGEVNYFNQFVLFYRIYISDIPMQSEITSADMNELNPALLADYSYFSTYTAATSSTVNLSTLFSNRHYYTLAVEGGTIETLLGSGLLANRTRTITLDFSENATPQLFIGAIPYDAIRSNGGGAFTPQPVNSRLFINTPDLYDANNAISITNTTTTVNADVVAKAVASQIVPGIVTYAAMYIAASGIDVNTLAPIYSVPTFISVFRLPSLN